MREEPTNHPPKSMTFDEQNASRNLLAGAQLTISAVEDADITAMQRIRQERQQFLQKQRLHHVDSVKREPDRVSTQLYPQDVFLHAGKDFPLELFIVNPRLPLLTKYSLLTEFIFCFIVGMPTVLCVLALLKDLWLQVSPLELFFSLLMAVGCVLGFTASSRLLHYRLRQRRLHARDGIYFSASALMIRQRGQWTMLPRHVIQHIDMTPKRRWWPENWRQTQYMDIFYRGLSSQGCSKLVLYRQSHRQLRRLIYSWLDNRAHVWQRELQASKRYSSLR